MKILKWITIVIIAVIFFLGIITMMLPSKYSVSRDIVINTGIDRAYQEILNSHTSHKWSPWDDIDPNITYTTEGKSGEIGNKLSWSSENSQVGNGSMTLISTVPGKQVVFRIEMQDYGSSSTSIYTTEQVPGGVKVTWADSGELHGIVMRWMGFFMNKMLGDLFEKGLNKLKTQLESAPASVLSDIARGYVSAQNIISIRQTITPAEIGPKLGEIYGQLTAYMIATGVQQVNAPLALLHHFDEQSIDMEPALPVDKLPPATNGVNAYELPQRDVVSGTFTGTYDKLSAAHSELQEWIKSNGYTIIGSPWESYITDPAMVKDTSKWKTVIYYPVQ